MAVANDGRIFVAALNLGIYVFSATGQYIDVISSPQEDIYAYSMAYTTASGGLLYVADLFNDRVVTFKVGTSSGGPSSDSSRTVSGPCYHCCVDYRRTCVHPVHQCISQVCALEPI